MVAKPQVEPYDFVPLVGLPERKRPVGHHRYTEGRYNGLMECQLTAKTPLFVYDPRFILRVDRGHETVNFPVFRGMAVIFGTSLKGVIRNVVEAIEPCCFTLPIDWEEGKRLYKGSGITQGKLVEVALPDPEFKHCDDLSRLCPACRLFGSLDHQGNWAYAGKVSISDAHSPPGEYALMDYITLDVLSTPKPEGRPQAYLREGNVIRGRKFYRHRYPPDVLERAPDKSGRPRRDRQNKTVQPVKEGSVFHFTVEYSDLDREELRLLLYALVLEEGVWHKVGLGKPIGLGSVQIEIVKWTQIDRQARYRALGEGIAPPLEGESLRAELTKWLQPYHDSQAEPIKKLRQILRPDPNVDVRYIVRWSPQ